MEKENDMKIPQDRKIKQRFNIHTAVSEHILTLYI